MDLARDYQQFGSILVIPGDATCEDAKNELRRLFTDSSLGSAQTRHDFLYEFQDYRAKHQGQFIRIESRTIIDLADFQPAPDVIYSVKGEGMNAFCIFSALSHNHWSAFPRGARVDGLRLWHFGGDDESCRKLQLLAGMTMPQFLERCDFFGWTCHVDGPVDFRKTKYFPLATPLSDETHSAKPITPNRE